MATPRATALKIGKWLVERNRVDEAIQIFAAFAASGPNDVEGQQPEPYHERWLERSSSPKRSA